MSVDCEAAPFKPCAAAIELLTVSIDGHSRCLTGLNEHHVELNPSAALLALNDGISIDINLPRRLVAHVLQAGRQDQDARPRPFQLRNQASRRPNTSGMLTGL